MEPNMNSTKGKQRAREVLEVEDEEQRHERMHELLSRVDGDAGASPPQVPRSFDFGDRSTFPDAPPLELLSRVQAFLPELAASNAELLRRAKEDPDSVDIEKFSEDQAQYIEMNLGLGVFESRGQAPANIPVADVDLDDVEMDSSEHYSSTSDSDSTSSSSSSPSDDSGSDSDSDSDSDPSEDSDVDDIVLPPLAPGPSATSNADARPIRPLPKRTRGQGGPSPGQKPEIVVLSESHHSDDDGNPSP
ncbi:hypothetical protein BD311DRAFT_758991 [Dichomitus squalens]|uniref:Uncharacterized protein n=1 Tax=Dichomitus squalens TaxID=114155 RepID=A0A4Q9ML47_9APHY|nr:hypothetical protein BD311DRAFT_758991 [Dichomitus squalens]